MKGTDIILTLKFTDDQYQAIKQEIDLLRRSSVNKTVITVGINALFSSINYEGNGFRIYVNRRVGMKALEELFSFQESLKDQIKFGALNSLYSTLYKGVNNIPL